MARTKLLTGPALVQASRMIEMLTTFPGVRVEIDHVMEDGQRIRMYKDKNSKLYIYDPASARHPITDIDSVKQITYMPRRDA